MSLRVVARHEGSWPGLKAKGVRERDAKEKFGLEPWERDAKERGEVWVRALGHRQL